MAGAAFMRASGPLIGSVSFAWSLTNGIDAPGLDVSFVFLLCGACWRRRARTPSRASAAGTMRR